MDRHQEKALPSRSTARQPDGTDVHLSSAKSYGASTSSSQGTHNAARDPQGHGRELSPMDGRSSFSRSRAVKGQQRSLAPLGIDPRRTTYSSISEANPFSHEDDTPVENHAQHAILRAATASPVKITGTPAKLRLVDSNFAMKRISSLPDAPTDSIAETLPQRPIHHTAPGPSYKKAQTAPRVPLESALDDIEAIRRRISPDAPHRLGYIVAGEDGLWNHWRSNGDKRGFWKPSQVPVTADLDPRKTCPEIHSDFIKICEESRDRELVAKCYQLIISATDEARIQAARPRLGASSELDVQELIDTVQAAYDRGVPNWRTDPNGSPTARKPGILKSPERNDDQLHNRSSDVSSRNVTFETYSTKTDEQHGTPSELYMRPATRTYMRNGNEYGGDVLNQLTLHHTQLPSANTTSPDFRIVDKGDGPRVYSKHHRPDCEHVDKVHDAANWKKSKPLARPEESPEPGPFPWQKVPASEAAIYSESRSRSALDHHPTLLKPSDQDLLQVPPGALPKTPSDPRPSFDRLSSSMYTASPDKPDTKDRPASGNSATSALLDKFPGLLSADEKATRTVKTDLKNPAAGKFFGGPGYVKRDLWTGEPVPEVKDTDETPKKPSAMKRFATLANKFVGKNLKTQSGGIVRRVSNKLRNSPSTAQSPTSTRPRTPSLSRSRAIVEDDDEEEDRKDQLPKISMGPGDQMWLQCRVEFILNLSANHFLMTQKCNNRLKPESVVKITKKWFNNNRPQPIEFMFDLKSQLELIQMNVDIVQFYGPRGATDIGRESMFQAWRSLLRELGIRTFCLPDHALKKMMVDAFRVIEMLGSDKEAFIEFQEMQKLVSETAEKAARREAAHKAKMKRRAEEHGVTRKVESPLLVSSRGIVNDDDAYYDDGIYKG